MVERAFWADEGGGMSRPRGLVVDVRPVAVALTFAAALALLLLSGMMLANLGIPWTEAGGSALLKIHPATYLAVLAFAAFAAAEGPVPLLGHLWRDSPGLIAFFGAIVLIGFQGVVVQKTPVSQIADNFVLAACLFAALSRLDRRELIRLAIAVQAILAVNSLLGYAEVLGHFRLTPFRINGVVLDYEWRATALLGHPLNNAVMTLIALVSLALGAWPVGRLTRWGLVGLHFGALLFFGSRSSLVLAVAALAAVGGVGTVRVLAGRRFGLGSGALVVAAATSLLIGGALALDAGAGDRLFARFVNDDGSAATRIAMLSVFRDMSWFEVLFGPDLAMVKAMQMKLDIAIAIESAYVGLVAFYGGFVTAFFLTGLAAFLAEFPRRFGAAVLLPIGLYLLTTATMSSFSTKSIELGLVVVILYPAFASRPLRRPAC